MTWHVTFSKSSAKDLLSIPKKQRLIILTWIKENLNECENPRAVHDVKQLRGTKNGWYWRVGSYRVLGQTLDDVIEIKVVHAGHRQGVYNNLPKL